MKFIMGFILGSVLTIGAVQTRPFVSTKESTGVSYEIDGGMGIYCTTKDLKADKPTFLWSRSQWNKFIERDEVLQFMERVSNRLHNAPLGQYYEERMLNAVGDEYRAYIIENFCNPARVH